MGGPEDVDMASGTGVTGPTTATVVEVTGIVEVTPAGDVVVVDVNVIIDGGKVVVVVVLVVVLREVVATTGGGAAGPISLGTASTPVAPRPHTLTSPLLISAIE
jgi:hypothetical protein